MTITGYDFGISQGANRYRRQGSTREIEKDFENALTEGGVGCGGYYCTLNKMQDTDYKHVDQLMINRKSSDSLNRNFL